MQHYFMFLFSFVKLKFQKKKEEKRQNPHKNAKPKAFLFWKYQSILIGIQNIVEF